jgi:8-oxo-dGTP pyrophosphatase MutT (NUDIX family)
MNMPLPKVPSRKAPAARIQVAALPLKKVGEETRVLLVTSRETQRWILPKGWPVKGMMDCDAAAKEAMEEAGVVGRVKKKPVGSYGYFKRLPNEFVPCRVEVFRLDVTEQRDNWRERGQRKLGWFMLADAAELVDEPELKSLLMTIKD